MRTPYALRTLIDEVRAIQPKIDVETKDPDGFDVYRVAVFKDVDKGVASLLLASPIDSRFESVTMNDGDLTISMVGNVHADDPAAFHLADGLAVLSVEEFPEGNPEVSRADLEALSRKALDEQFPQHSEAKNKKAMIDAIMNDR